MRIRYQASRFACRQPWGENSRTHCYLRTQLGPCYLIYDVHCSKRTADPRASDHILLVLASRLTTLFVTYQIYTPLKLVRLHVMLVGILSAIPKFGHGPAVCSESSLVMYDSFLVHFTDEYPHQWISASNHELAHWDSLFMNTVRIRFSNFPYSLTFLVVITFEDEVDRLSDASDCS